MNARMPFEYPTSRTRGDELRAVHKPRKKSIYPSHKSSRAASPPATPPTTLPALLFEFAAPVNLGGGPVPAAWVGVTTGRNPVGETVPNPPSAVPKPPKGGRTTVPISGVVVGCGPGTRPVSISPETVTTLKRTCGTVMIFETTMGVVGVGMPGVVGIPVTGVTGTSTVVTMEMTVTGTVETPGTGGAGGTGTTGTTGGGCWPDSGCPGT